MLQCRERLKPFPLFLRPFSFYKPLTTSILTRTPSESSLKSIVSRHLHALRQSAKKKLDDFSSSLKDGGYLLSHLV